MTLATRLWPFLVLMVVYIAKGVQLLHRQTSVRTVRFQDSWDYDGLFATHVLSSKCVLWQLPQKPPGTLCASLVPNHSAEAAPFRFEKFEFKQSVTAGSSACTNTAWEGMRSLGTAMVVPQVSFSPWLDSLPGFMVEVPDLKQIRQRLLRLNIWVAHFLLPAWVYTLQLMVRAKIAIGDWGPSRDRFWLVPKIWLGFEVLHRSCQQRFVWRTGKFRTVWTNLWSHVSSFLGPATTFLLLSKQLEIVVTTLLGHCPHAWLVEVMVFFNLTRAAERLPCTLTFAEADRPPNKGRLSL